jgi:2-phospho-L-lactate guanylyltransferase
VRTLLAVPVKDLANAKQRLVPVLTPARRRDLARAMLVDVLAAALGAGPDPVLVVTPDAEVADAARGAGALVLAEAVKRGHTEAVATAQAHAAREGFERFITVPGDVPLVTPDELRALWAASPAGPRAVFVPSRSGFGTNAACLLPPGLLPLKFGEPSFANHLEAARARGLEPVVLHLPGLALDVDGPEDLVALARSAGGGASVALARSWGLG